MTLPLVLPATLTANTPQNVNDLNSNLNAIVTEYNAALPQVRVTNTIAQSIPNATLTALTFDTETYDTGTPSNNMHDTGSNTSRLTCRVAGLYLIQGIATFTGSVSAYRQAGLRVNGTTHIPGSGTYTGYTPTSSPLASLYIANSYRLAVNDYIELMVFQNTGGALNTGVDVTNGPDTRPMFSATFISQ